MTTITPELLTELLTELEAQARAATPGPWYPRATDDEHFMNARFVGTHIGPTRREWKFPDGSTHILESADGFMHDNKQGLAEDSPDQEPTENVIAITLLQLPRLAEAAYCDQNTRFIAAAHPGVVLALIARIRALEQMNADLTAQVVNGPEL